MSVAAQIVENLLDGDIDPKDELDGMQARDPHFGAPDPYSFDAFTRSYLETALWSSNDESNEQGGDPMDKNYGLHDMSAQFLTRSEEECAAFKAENAADLDQMEDVRAGHNFWLSRNGHGTGFFDEDTIPEDAQDRLQDAAKAYGEVNLYVGDDGQIYGH